MLRWCAACSCATEVCGGEDGPAAGFFSREFFRGGAEGHAGGREAVLKGCYVVDASVALAWVLPREDSEKAWWNWVLRSAYLAAALESVPPPWLLPVRGWLLNREAVFAIFAWEGGELSDEGRSGGCCGRQGRAEEGRGGEGG